MKLQMMRLGHGLAAFSIAAVLLIAVSSAGRAQEATPIVSGDDVSSSDVLVQVQFELDLCYDSATPGVTDWILEFEEVEPSSSVCNVQYVDTYDPPITISAYDAETMTLVDSVLVDGPTLTGIMELPAGSYVFGESYNDTVSEPYDLDVSSLYALLILPHTADHFVTPAPGDGDTSFGAQMLRCVSDNPALQGYLYFASVRIDGAVQPAAELGGTCDYSSLEGSFSDLGTLYLDRLATSPVDTAAIDSTVLETYGPWTSSPMTVAAYPQGTYQFRFERFDGSTQVTDPFIFSGLGQTGTVIIYEGSPPATPTETATPSPTPTETTTATSTVEPIGTVTSAAPTPTTVVNSLPNTGSGESGTGSLWMALGVLLAIGMGSLLIATRTHKRRA